MPASRQPRMIKRRALIQASVAAAAASLARVAQASARGGEAKPVQAHAAGSRSARGQPAGARSAQSRADDATQRVASPPRRIGLALGSGSIHGLAHVGVLRELERRGLRPAVVAGTSAGALVGVLHAAGLDLDAIESIARSLDWQRSGRLVWPSRGLMRNGPLQRRIDAAVGARRLEALPTPFGAVATDIVTGERVLLRTGACGLAVGASSSIPVLFAPVRVGRRDLVDGSLTEPVPADAAREMGADFVIAVDVAYRPGDAAPRGITDMAFQMMHVMVNALIAEQIRRADFALRLDLHRLMLGSWNADTLIEEGERVMREAWPELERALGANPAISVPGTSRPPR